MLEYPKTYRENLLYRAGLKLQGEREGNKAGAIRELFKRNMLWAFNTWFWTWEPRGEPQVRPLITWGFQDDYAMELLAAIEGGYDIAIYKSRDMAGTVTVLAVIQWCWQVKGWDFRLGSRKEALVDKRGDMDSLFEKVRFNLRFLPAFLLPEKFDFRKHDKALILENPELGNSIVGEATGSSFGVGGRKKAILYDEFARWDQDYAAWDAATDITPCRIALSTPSERGLGCKYAEIVTKRKCKIIDLPWRLHPNKDEGWYEAQKARRTKQDMAINVDRDFLAAAGMVFDKESVAAYLAQCVEGKRGYLTKEKPAAWLFRNNGIWFIENPEGDLQVWRWPSKEKWANRYCGAGDVAEGLPKGDWSVCGIRDRHLKDHVAQFRSRKVDPGEFAEEMALLGTFYDNALLGPETNGGYGYACLKRLRELYSNIYIRQVYDKTNKQTTKHFGALSTHEGKKTMAVELDETLKGHELGLWDFETVSELSTFVRDERGRVAGSGDSQDDCVMAFMIEEMVSRSMAAPRKMDQQDEEHTGWRAELWGPGGKRDAYDIAAM